MNKVAVLIAVVVLLLGLNVYQFADQPDAALPELTRQQLSDQFHLAFGAVSKNLWYGIPTWQNPVDVWMTQEIMFETKPDFVVETGTFRGGSAVLWAAILENISLGGRIITIDIKDARVPAAKGHPLAVERVDFLLGSSTDPKIVAEVKRRVKDRKVLLILDSLHTRDHVLDELNAYWELVDVGGYIVVQDSAINGHPIAPDWGPGPWEAVEDFLEVNDHFEIDESRERYGWTNNPNGFLKRVR